MNKYDPLWFRLALIFIALLGLFFLSSTFMRLFLWCVFFFYLWVVIVNIFDKLREKGYFKKNDSSL